MNKNLLVSTATRLRTTIVLACFLTSFGAAAEDEGSDLDFKTCNIEAIKDDELGSADLAKSVSSEIPSSVRQVKKTKPNNKKTVESEVNRRMKEIEERIDYSGGSGEGRGGDGDKWAPKIGGSSSCFAGETMIDTVSGRMSIESIRVGMTVKTMNLNTGEIVNGKVAKVFKHSQKFVCGLKVNGVFTRVTPNHPFIYDFKKKSLAIGRFWTHRIDSVFVRRVDENGMSLISKVKIQEYGEISSEIQYVDVYNLTVLPHNNYFANGVLVHNMNK